MLGSRYKKESYSKEVYFKSFILKIIRNIEQKKWREPVKNEKSNVFRWLTAELRRK